MSKTMIDKMVVRFLGWKLPEDFSPDHYINFDREAARRLQESTNGTAWPTGTDLLNADQARAMIEHMLAGVIPRDEQSRALADGDGVMAAHQSAAEDEYFAARPQLDCNDRRKVFEAGFQACWNTVLSYRYQDWIPFKMPNVVQDTTAARKLADLVLSMELVTDKGLLARRLAREALGIPDHGRAPATDD